MNNIELWMKMIKVKNNLQNVKIQLKNAQNILNQSITFNNKGFKSSNFKNLDSKLNKQINNLSTKIIPKIFM